MNETDWRETYLNYTRRGLGAIDPDSYNRLKSGLLIAWIDLAKAIGLEHALLLFRDDSLRRVLLPELSSWNELVERLDTRHCTATFTLVNIFRWFFWVQLACVAACLIPAFIMFCRKRLICRTEWRKNRLFFVIGNPKTEIAKRESQTSLKDAFTVLHIENVESEWLPDRLRPLLKKEDKRAKLNREMINEFRRKLLASQEHFQQTMTRTVHSKFSIEDNRETIGCVGLLTRWFDKWRGRRQETHSARRRKRKKKDLAKLTGRRKLVLRRVESAICANEYERERGMVNQHLVPSEDRSLSELYETQSMWDIIRK